MTSVFKTFAGMATVVTAVVTGAAHSQTTDSADFTPKKAGEFAVTVRATDVDPAAKGDILTAAETSTGLHIGVNSDTIPSLGFTYFLTNHLAAEAILGTSQHTISAVGTMSTDVYKTWVLPPVVTLQYHFSPSQRVSPYVGAGLSFMDWYSGKD